MDTDSLHERAKALEESFYHRKNKELLEKLRNDLQTKEQKEALAAASGIEDETVLDELLAVGIQSETLAAVALVPLVAVSWADGTVQDEEREAIMSAAAEEGIGPESACHTLLEQWLTEPPASALLETWKDYINALRKTLDEQHAAALKSKVIGRARKVAEAAGGFLGIGKVSASEKAVLKDLESAFA